MKYKCKICGEVFEAAEGEEAVCPVCKDKGEITEASEEVSHSRSDNEVILFRELAQAVNEASDRKVNRNVLKKFLAEKDLITAILSNNHNIVIIGVTPNGYMQGVRLTTCSFTDENGKSGTMVTVAFPESVKTMVLENINILIQRSEDHNARIKAAEKQRKIARTSINADKPWSEKEIGALIKMYKRGTTAVGIGGTLGRPYKQIDKMIEDLKNKGIL